MSKESKDKVGRFIEGAIELLGLALLIITLSKRNKK